MTSNSLSSTIEIAHDGPKQVVFVPENNDKYVMNVTDTFVATQRDLRAREEREETSNKVRTLLDSVCKWVEKHWDSIRSAYLHFSNGQFSMVVVQTAGEVNVDLENSLIDLDIEIAQNKAIRPMLLDVMLLPDCDDECVDTFISKDERLELKNASNRRPPQLS